MLSTMGLRSVHLFLNLDEESRVGGLDAAGDEADVRLLQQRQQFRVVRKANGGVDAEVKRVIVLAPPKG